MKTLTEKCQQNTENWFFSLKQSVSILQASTQHTALASVYRWPADTVVGKAHISGKFR